MKRYKSQFMESSITDLWSSIKSIAFLLDHHNIKFTIIGGAARNQYGYSKMTEDIDILIAKEDKEKVLNLPIGSIRDLSNKRGKVFSLHNPKTKVEVIYSGEISGDGINGLKYDDPDKISTTVKGVPFMTLKKLIEYKLSSGIYGKRLKDFADIIGLIKENNLKQDYANNFRKDLKKKYIELWNNANEQIDEI